MLSESEEITNNLLNDEDSYKKLNKRIEESKILTEMFDDFISENNSLCISGDNTNFRKYLSNIEIIGKGAFGVVYKAKFLETFEKKQYDSFVIKEALIDDDDEEIYSKKYKNKIKNYFASENIFLEAIRTKILEKKLCPNFTFFYNVAKCDSCVIQRLFDKTIKNGRCYVTFMEAASFDFSNKTLSTLDSQFSMIHQLLIGFHYLHSVLSIIHNDFKPANILVKRIKPGGYFKYTIGKDVFFVKNVGFLFFISDFGLSTCYNPDKIKFISIASRVAEVVYDGLKPKFKPLKQYHGEWGHKEWREIKMRDKKWCEKNLRDKKWYDKGKLVTTFSEEKIDVNQPNRFPPFVFFYDIQNVLKLFVGGEHYAFKNMPKLTKTLEFLIIRNIFPQMTDDVNDVKLILAIEMLKEFYSTPNIDFIIDEFGN
jgi:serine/threonine protein kinase